ncbi:MAG: serine/threonine protein kinase [Verrucomicrobia bacterium]|nr:serine/threonine protein kinase [Verrucomicrobiota bacterium]
MLDHSALPFVPKKPKGAWALRLAGVPLLAIATVAQDTWPQFRGPEARGIGHSPRLPLVWGPETHVAWRISIPGRGWSSPIVWGSRVFLTTVVSEGETEPPKKGLYFGGDRPEPSPHRHRWQVLCLDWASGKTLWTKEVHAAPPSTPIHVKNSYASETPVTDGERVYAYFGHLGLYCLSTAGDILWSQPFTPRKMAHGWGTSASPVLEGDRVYVVNDNEEESFAAAYDTRTGREVWRVPRDEPSNFATPFIWSHEQRTELVTPGRKRVRSYDLEGRLLWELRGLSSITIPTPFAADGLLYLAAGYVGDRLQPNKPVYAIKPGGTGDLTLPGDQRASQFIAWLEPNAAPYNPSTLVYQGRFYVLWDFGFLSARDAHTGRELYDKQRLKPDGAAGFTASPWAYRGRVFCLSEDGDTYVCTAGDTFHLERVNSLGEMCMATPALVHDSLLIRTLSHLYRIE